MLLKHVKTAKIFVENMSHMARMCQKYFSSKRQKIRIQLKTQAQTKMPKVCMSKVCQKYVEYIS